MIRFPLLNIKIHPVFWLVIAAGAVTGHLWETGIAFFLVLIHEYGHAIAAYRFGWTVREIELLPFGGVAQLDGEEGAAFSQECAVLLAGPLQHVWLPFFSLAMTLTPFWNHAQHQIFLEQNLALLLFNLLPIWPLDGGRLLHLYFQKRYPYKAAYKKMLLFSMIAITFFIVLLFFIFPFSINLWLVFSFIVISLYKERQVLSYRFIRFLMALSRRRTPELTVRKLVVPPEMPVSSVLALFYKYSDHRIIIEGRCGPAIEDKRLIRQFFSGRFEGKTVEESLLSE
ncbi:stage IV sporulation protein FB [Sporolactobacillus sp. THM7-7]|nr:stage IV sporulation protein FB [Sporolactobacillus sp. THM7-7]